MYVEWLNFPHFFSLLNVSYSSKIFYSLLLFLLPLFITSSLHLFLIILFISFLFLIILFVSIPILILILILFNDFLLFTDFLHHLLPFSLFPIFLFSYFPHFILKVDDLKNRLGLDAQAQKVDWGTLGVLGKESLAKLKLVKNFIYLLIY